MKAKAPEKIYLEAIYPDNGVLPNGLNYTPSPTDIEYVRTDAFIEKAISFLENDVCCYIVAQDFAIEHERLEKDFRKYVEEQV